MHLGHVAFDLGDHVEGLCGGGQEALAFRRRCHAARFPIKQREAEASLDLRQGPAHRRLAQMHTAGRLGQRAGAGDGVDNAEVTDFDHVATNLAQSAAQAKGGVEARRAQRRG